MLCDMCTFWQVAFLIHHEKLLKIYSSVLCALPPPVPAKTWFMFLSWISGLLVATKITGHTSHKVSRRNLSKNV